jgi:hypothetical protein
MNNITKNFNKYLHSIALLIPVLMMSSFVASQDFKWGLSVGINQVDNEYVSTDTDGSEVNRDTEWSALTYGLDVSSGKHSFNVSFGTADEESPSFSGSGAYEFSANDTVSLDMEDFSMNYTYRLNPNWTIGLGMNELTHDFEFASSEAISWNGDRWDADGSYNRGYTDDEEINIDGLTLLLGYNTQLSQNWFFTTKIGYLQQDLEFTGTSSSTYTGFSPTLNSCYSGGTCPIVYSPPIAANTGIEGDGYTDNYKYTGDASSVVFGMGLVWVVNPRNQIYFDYTIRGLEYDDLDYTVTGGARAGGFFDAFVGEPPVTNTEQISDKVENDYHFFSMRWRYSLN